MKPLLFVLMNVMLGMTSLFNTVAITNSSLLANSLTGLKRFLQWRTLYYQVDAFSLNSVGSSSSSYPTRRLLYYNNHGSNNAISMDRTLFRHTTSLPTSSTTTRLFVSTDPTPRSTDASKKPTTVVYVSETNGTEKRIPKKFVPKPFEVK